MNEYQYGQFDPFSMNDANYERWLSDQRSKQNHAVMRQIQHQAEMDTYAEIAEMIEDGDYENAVNTMRMMKDLEVEGRQASQDAWDDKPEQSQQPQVNPFTPFGSITGRIAKVINVRSRRIE